MRQGRHLPYSGAPGASWRPVARSGARSDGPAVCRAWPSPAVSLRRGASFAPAREGGYQDQPAGVSSRTPLAPGNQGRIERRVRRAGDAGHVFSPS